MTPEQFLAEIRKPGPAPVYLFLGPEMYRRELCRKALVERLLEPAEREQGLVRHDLEETPLAAVIDDACSLSLFAPTRLMWLAGAEAALPRSTRAAAGDGGDQGDSGGLLAGYLKNPAPGVVMVFDASRYEFDGEDKTRIERVRKFYSGIARQVEFPRFRPAEARDLAVELARHAGLKIESDDIDLLVEALGGDAARIAVEMEKLRLWAGAAGQVSREAIAELVPDSRSTTVFALVAALGRGDRVRSLELLDTLIREGEYLPLALAFLATQFRLALVAKEAGLRNAHEVQAHFSRLGYPMWRARAEQVCQTVAAFSRPQLARAVEKVYAADRALRDARPDDRTVMENFVLRLTR